MNPEDIADPCDKANDECIPRSEENKPNAVVSIWA
jgi:hypothetical protein